MHLLLIEDDLDLGRALQSALKVEGLTSEWFRRLSDAPKDTDLLSFDCVLLDLTLPDGSGFDLLSHWRSRGSLTPVIIVTAHGDVKDRLAGLEAQMISSSSPSQHQSWSRESALLCAEAHDKPAIFGDLVV
jgi:two-component system, OmpR family, response regulator QseB